jgi:hypothetical protein
MSGAASATETGLIQDASASARSAAWNGLPVPVVHSRRKLSR